MKYRITDLMDLYEGPEEHRGRFSVLRNRAGGSPTQGASHLTGNRQDPENRPLRLRKHRLDWRHGFSLAAAIVILVLGAGSILLLLNRQAPNPALPSEAASSEAKTSSGTTDPEETVRTDLNLTLYLYYREASFDEGMPPARTELRSTPTQDAPSVGGVYEGQRLAVLQAAAVSEPEEAAGQITVRPGQMSVWYLVSTGREETSAIGWLHESDLVPYEEPDEPKVGRYYVLREGAAYWEDGVDRTYHSAVDGHTVLCLERIEEESHTLVLSGWGGITVTVHDSNALEPYANALPASWANVP